VKLRQAASLISRSVVLAKTSALSVIFSTL